ncbi:MAG: hypothetical protein ACXWUG_29320, partial [Polyangiales bacterium]
PFVVEWDATDLASFEARSQRDTIFVKYTGCKLEVLDGCSDNAIGGKFGSYGSPQWTSGTVQGFDVKDEGELYAKLPLGAVTLAGRVAAGETLHLKYFVAGVATSSRAAIYRSDIASYAGCKGATHFVWAYNLGAFELDSTSHMSGEAEASVMGAGAGGKASHEEASLGHGGDLKSCTTNNQLQCRVPIRLALRKIDDSADPAGGPPPAMTASNPGMPPPGMPPAGAPTLTGMDAWLATPAGQANASYMSALKKLEAGDGEGCLKDMDRALKLDAKQFDNHGFRYSRARCEMRAGKCDDGKKDLRDTLAAEDTKKIKSDEQLDKEVRQVANRECPSSTAKTDADFVERASHELGAASQAKDGKMCQAKADAIFARMPKLDKKDPEQAQARQRGIMALESGAICIAVAKTCSAGEPMWIAKYKLQLSGMSNVEKIAKESWATMVKQHPQLKGCKQ